MSAASTLQLDLKPSLKLAGLLLVVHVLALAATWASLAGWPQVLVGFGILLSGTGCLAEVLHRSSRAAVSLELREDGRASWRGRNGGGGGRRVVAGHVLLRVAGGVGVRVDGRGRGQRMGAGAATASPGVRRMQGAL